MPFTNRPYYFHLDTTESPTCHQLAQHLSQAGWKPTRMRWRAHFTEANLHFNEKAAASLEQKHLLADMVNRHCPQIMPPTYAINDSNWPAVLNQIANRHYPRSVDEIASLKWILKPALLNNGQHIHIFERLSDIERFYLSSRRLGGEHVIQQYLAEPHLLQGPKLGHKYSLRMFVVLASSKGAFLYPDGYFNIALHPYPGNAFQDLKPHLTNEHLSHDELNVVQIPTCRYSLFKPFYPQIKNMLSGIMQALSKEHPLLFQQPSPASMAIFGFDFMVDAEERLWLLEANHGPCFPIKNEHPLQQSLYTPFWQALLQEFVFPMVNNETAHKGLVFEKIGQGFS